MISKCRIVNLTHQRSVDTSIEWVHLVFEKVKVDKCREHVQSEPMSILKILGEEVGTGTVMSHRIFIHLR